MSDKQPNYIWKVVDPFPVDPILKKAYMDGDTIDMLIDHGFCDLAVQRFRLFGINAPERFSDEGKAATQALRDYITAGMPITVESFKMGDFRRWLGILYDKDGNSINQMMLDNGFAVPYVKK